MNNSSRCHYRVPGKDPNERGLCELITTYTKDGQLLNLWRILKFNDEWKKAGMGWDNPHEKFLPCHTHVIKDIPLYQQIEQEQYYSLVKAMPYTKWQMQHDLEVIDCCENYWEGYIFWPKDNLAWLAYYDKTNGYQREELFFRPFSE